MSDVEFMACGCRIATRDLAGAPVCIIHDTRETKPAPDLTGRVARCSYDNSGRHSEGRPGVGWRVQPGPVPSSWSLPFFRHQPDRAEDSYYCGCWGWD